MNLKLDNYDAVILSGGLGTRISSILPKNTAKIMLSINNTPFLDYILSHIYESGLRRVILALGYGANGIIHHIEHNQYPDDFMIKYTIEREPLGTAGALTKALKYVESKNIFVFNGDTLTLVDLRKLLFLHTSKDAYATISLVKKLYIKEYGYVVSNDNDEVISFNEKPQKSIKNGYINSGVYILNKTLLESLDKNTNISIEKNIFPSLIGNRLYSLKTHSEFIDIGNLEILKQSRNKLKNIKHF